MQKVMNVATSSLQSYKPVNNICQHVCAFHFYANDMSRQVRSSALPQLASQEGKCTLCSQPSGIVLTPTAAVLLTLPKALLCLNSRCPTVLQMLGTAIPVLM